MSFYHLEKLLNYVFHNALELVGWPLFWLCIIFQNTFSSIILGVIMIMTTCLQRISGTTAVTVRIYSIFPQQQLKSQLYFYFEAKNSDGSERYREMLIVDNSCVYNDFMIYNVQNSFFSIAGIWKGCNYSPSPTPVRHIALIYLAYIFQHNHLKLKEDYFQREGTVLCSQWG